MGENLWSLPLAGYMLIHFGDVGESKPMKLHEITSSTAQGGGGSFKNRKPIGEIGCCESGMAERIH